ncbi:hypothetical protein P692DRAFT_20824452 [Suillus brevipes Sb2]|nr:hypothetical protein P692DRAFT_20824452 [Suillus brevipes Sb2]
MEDERPVAAKRPRRSSASTTIELLSEDELRGLYASARDLTGYLKKQRGAEASLKLADRWIP